MSCPICSSNKIKLIDELVFYRINRCSEAINFSLCKFCGFIFYRHSSVESLYDENNSKYFNSNSGSGANSFYDKKRLRASFNFVSKNVKIKENLKVLDIGCNNGYFLSLFKKKTNKLFGIDILLNKEIENKNFKLRKSKKINEFNIKFDLITVNHVLEQVENIKLFLSEIQSITKNNGRIYIEVPDAERYYKYHISPYSYFDLEHINHFKLNDLIRLINQFESLTIRELNRGEFKMSKDYKYPFIGLLIEKNDSKKSLKDYINYNKHLLNDFYETNEKFVVYGVGASTLRTLSIFKINLDSVLFFVDKNKSYHNSKIENKIIKPPTSLKDKNYKVIIFSELYFNEIKNDLKDIGFKGETINFWNRHEIQ